MGLGSGIRDPGSGKNLVRIPDPGVKKAPVPGSGSATLLMYDNFNSGFYVSVRIRTHHALLSKDSNSSPLEPSVADPGCLPQIPDPNLSIPNSGPRLKKIPDPGSASKNFIIFIFNPKNCFPSLGQIIWDVLSGSGFFYIQDSGSGAFLSEICGGK